METEATGELAVQVKAALAQKERPYAYREAPDDKAQRRANIRLEFTDPDLRRRATDAVLTAQWHCQTPCVVLDLGEPEPGKRKLALIQRTEVQRFTLDLTRPVGSEATSGLGLAREEGGERTEIKKDSTVEVRPYAGRQIYVDGKPMGEPFD